MYNIVYPQLKAKLVNKSTKRALQRYFSVFVFQCKASADEYIAVFKKLLSSNC